MWKRDQTVKPATPQPATPAAPSPQVAPPLVVAQATKPVDAIEPAQQKGRSEPDMVNIGKSVVIKGDLQGSEDLTIEGQVEGTIQLNDHVLTVGANGRLKAQVFAKTVIVLGTVRGNVSASEKVDIRDGATVDGDVVAPRVAIAEGAQFHGSVDMQQGKRTQQPTAAASAGAKPTVVPASTERDQPRAAASTH
jgi:cytoskeletal protein CcmA (bactofilin family)